MSRALLLLALMMALFVPAFCAEDDGPPISITSPDTGTTYSFGTIKQHALVWSKSKKMLVAIITFTDEGDNQGSATDDTHEFRLPGISYDAAKGLFTATTAKGEVIPVAHYKKVLFVKSIETLPNAAVRVVHPGGVITVVLEAISPDDPAMRAPANGSDSDGTHQIGINQILN